ncbi:hypothetical protein NKG05_16810 [Oerskovia sp. M15]
MGHHGRAHRDEQRHRDGAGRWVPGFTVVDSPETDEAPDYRHRNRVDFTYEGEGGTYEGVLWGLADDDKHVVMAQLTGTDLDPDLVATIDESLEVTG